VQVKHGLSVCSNFDVPFVGDIWARPVSSYEFGPAVFVARKLSQKLDSALQLSPAKAEQLHSHMRDLASYKFLFWAGLILLLVWLIWFS